MTITFKDEAEVLDYFMETGEVWLSLVAADSWPYILTSTENGDVFVQGFPEEDTEDGGTTTTGAEWLSDKPERWYPVTLVAPLPEASDG